MVTKYLKHRKTNCTTKRDGRVSDERMYPMHHFSFFDIIVDRMVAISNVSQEYNIEKRKVAQQKIQNKVNNYRHIF